MGRATFTRPSPGDFDQQEHDDLGGGLTSREYFYWQTRKREQILSHNLAGHRGYCPTCKLCLCGRDDVILGDAGFRCRCHDGKLMATPYRLRYLSVAKPKGFESTDYVA